MAMKRSIFWLFIFIMGSGHAMDKASDVMKASKSGMASEANTISKEGGIGDALHQEPQKKSEILSLKDAVLLGVRTNPSARSAKLQWVVDRFSYAVNVANFLPQWRLTAEANASHGSRRTVAAYPTVSWKMKQGVAWTLKEDTSTHQATLQVESPLLRGLGHVAAADLYNAQDQLSVERLGLESALIHTVDAVLSAYWNLIAAMEGQKVERLGYDQAKKLYAQYKLKVEVGELARSNLMQQSSQLLQSRLALSRQQTTVDQKKRALMLQLGLDPSAAITIDPRLSDVHDFKLWPLKKSIDYALKHNLSYRQALLNQLVLKRQVEVARDDQRWALNLSAAADTSGERSATLSLSIPIDDRARKQRLLSAEMAEKQGRLNLMSMRQSLRAEVIDAWASAHAQLEQIKITEEKVKLSQKNYAIAVEKNLVGRSSAFEVVQQQKVMIEDALSLINLKVGYLTTLSQFHAKLGLTLLIWGVHVAT